MLYIDFFDYQLTAIFFEYEKNNVHSDCLRGFDAVRLWR